MIDKQGRTIDYIRISLTDRCNLRCVYCMPEEGIVRIPHEQILRYDEIERIVRCMVKLGVHKVKLTGGEPLVRKDCAELAGHLKQIPGIEKVTLTTNGLLLKKEISALAAAGIDGINISLDTLNAELYEQITRAAKLNDVLEGMEAALSYPQISVKINVVPVVRDSENLIALAGLAKHKPVHVRFIEMMPIGYGKQFTFYEEDSILAVLEKEYGPLALTKECLGNGPCRYFEAAGFQGKIGFISAMTHKFCNQCNRVRLTAEGYLKACLQYETGINLRDLLRSNCTDDMLIRAIQDVIRNKPVSHNFHEKYTQKDEKHMMSQIGG